MSGSTVPTDAATFTLTERPAEDRRVVTVDSVGQALDELTERCRTWPQAAAVCDDVLRSSIRPGRPGPGWSPSRWRIRRCSRDPSSAGGWPNGVRRPRRCYPSRCRRIARGTPCTSGSTGRSGTTRSPPMPGARCWRHARWPRLDPSVDEVVLGGNGRSFCSGGDLAEFGSFADPASAHLARTRHSPALVLAEITERLGRRCRAEVHGQVLGSGLEMACYCGWVSCHPDAAIGLPELALGLIPGAGGTVSITRRIGRWRTAYLVLSGRTVDAATALTWGLVDEVVVSR